MKTKMKIIANDLLKEFAGSKLYDLPSEELSMGGRLDELARAAGYASGRDFANGGTGANWSMPLDEALDMLRGNRN